MMSTIVKRAAVLALLAGLGSNAAWACDVGNIQCDNAGYRYVCQCYTSSGCQYYPDGTCSAYHGDRPENLTRTIGYVDRSGDLASKLRRLGREQARPPSP